MKYLFRFYMILFFSFFAFSYYAHAIDLNYKDLQQANMSADEICQNGGQDGTGTIIADDVFDFSYNNLQTAYAFFKIYYKSFDYEQYPPNYLIENDNKRGYVTHVYDYTKVDDDNAKIHYKTIECSACPNTMEYVTGKDTYGRCTHPESPEIKDIGDTPEQICSKNGGTVDKSTEYDNTFYWIRGNSEIKYWKGQKISRGDNSYLNGKTIRLDNTSSAISYTLAVSWSGGELSNGAYRGKLKSLSFRCNCPSGSVDEYGRCEPTNCPKPKIETSPHTCENTTLCDDGAPKLSGSCDRSCESMGMYTEYYDHDLLLWTPLQKRCVQTFDCENIAEQCAIKCGSVNNVKESPLCNTTTGITGSCICKDDNLDNQVPDPDEIDDNSTDSEISNSLLKQIKNESLKQTQHLDEINSLLYTQNQNDLTRESQLNSIDGKLSNIDGSLNNIDGTLQNMNNTISGVKDSVDGVKNSVDDLKQSQDESNTWLGDIFDKLSSFYDFFVDGSNQLTQQATDLKNQIDNEIANAESIEDLDLNSQTQGMLDGVVSKYQNALGFSTSYGARPQNITVTLFDKQYTMIDFSVLDNHISVIRNLFLTLAYLTGFMILIKKD